MVNIFRKNPEQRKRHVHFGEIQVMTKTASTAIFLLILPILLSVVFGLPFPFAKQIWFTEYMGYYGLVNSVFLVLIALGIEKRMSWSAVFAGFGLCLHEFLINLRGFVYLYHVEALKLPSVLFFVSCCLFTGGVCVILGYALYAVHLSDRFHLEKEAPTIRFLEKKFFLSVSLCVYPIALWALLAINPESKSAFFLLRFLGAAVIVPSFISAGFEIVEYLSRNKIFFLLLAIFHEITLAVILWLIHVKLPVRLLIEF